MADPKEIKKIARFLTDDPDIFNEMAMSTGAISAPPGGNIKRSKKQRRSEGEDDIEGGLIQKYIPDPVSGQSKAKLKSGKTKKAGEVLFSGEKDEEPTESVD